MASHKPGYITASTVSPFLTGKGDKLIKGGIQAATEIALERYGVIDDVSGFQGNSATEWGNTHEPIAIEAYERETFQQVTDSQKQVEQGWLSCTPDGYVGEDGLVEIKCPYASKNHLANILSKDFVGQYWNQVQFQLMLTERNWCDLVSFDPRFPDETQVIIERIYPDAGWQKRCMNRMEQAEAIIENILNTL